VSQLRIYPVKSLAGVRVDEALVQPWGLQHDRRWLLLNPDGTALTAREHHATLGIVATPQPDGSVQLQARGGSTLCVQPPVRGDQLPTSVSRLDSVRAAGAEVDVWLSHQLGRSVRLGWLDDPRRRTVSEERVGLPGDLLSLADAGPILLTTTSSLDQLNQWVREEAAGRGDPAPSDLEMTRFRPNLVVEGPDEPFAEDSWSKVRIGRVEFRFAEMCSRCVLTTIDPSTCQRGKEPLRSLARHRLRDGQVWFGIRMTPVSTGPIRVGDAVEVGPPEP